MSSAGNNEQRNLPPSWRWTRLGDTAEFLNGRAFKPEEWNTVGLPIIRIQNLTSPEADFNFFSGSVDLKNKVENGDLLISWSASLDAYIWKGGPAVLNQHIFKVAERKEVITREYLYFAVREVMDEIRSQVHGATMRHITKPEFEEVMIPLPPREEQKRIAAILNAQMAAVERARAVTEAQLEATCALPSAYLRAAFSSPEAQQWPRKPLGQVSELLPSKSIASDGDVEVLAVTTACLTESGFRPDGIKRARMWASDVSECLLSPGEVLVARSNTPELVGRVAMFTGEPSDAVASDLTIRLRPNIELKPAFITSYLSFLYLGGYWKERAGGASGTMKKITRSQLVKEQIPLPSVATQEEVAERLSKRMVTANQARKAVEDQLEMVNKLPAAILRRAFSGEL